MNQAGDNLVIGMCGLATSIVTAFALVYLELSVLFAFYSLVYFLVLPIGAIISGGVAASGYYIGARWVNARPTKKILVSMIVISVATFFLIQYMTYLLLEFDGKSVSELVPFFQYMDARITKTSMALVRIPFAETGELGNIGYGIAVLQICGFALGGLIAYEILEMKPFCEDCNKYRKKVWKEARFYRDEERFKEHEKLVTQSIDAHDMDIEAVRQRHRESGEENFKVRKTNWKSTLSLMVCPSCERHWLAYEAFKYDGMSWAAMMESWHAGAVAQTTDRVRPAQTEN